MPPFTKEHCKNISLSKMGNIPWNKRGMIKKCPTCKRIFDISPSREEKITCCSKKCSNINKKGNIPCQKMSNRGVIILNIGKGGC